MKQVYPVMYNRPWNHYNHKRYYGSIEKIYPMTWLTNGVFVFGNNDEVYYKWIETKR